MYNPQQIKELAPTIGQELLDVNKEVSKKCKDDQRFLQSVQQTVYKTIDYVNMVSSRYKTAEEERQRLHSSLQRDGQQATALQSENVALKKKIEALEKKLTLSERRAETHLEDLNQARREKDDLTAKTQTISEREQEYMNKVKLLEQSLRQAPLQSAEADQSMMSGPQTQSFMRTSTSVPSSPR